MPWREADHEEPGRAGERAPAGADGLAGEAEPGGVPGLCRVSADFRGLSSGLRAARARLGHCAGWAGYIAAWLRQGADQPFPRRAPAASGPCDPRDHGCRYQRALCRDTRCPRVGVPFAVTGARAERQRPEAAQVYVLPGPRGATKVPLPCTVMMIPRSRSTAIACRTVV